MLHPPFHRPEPSACLCRSPPGPGTSMPENEDRHTIGHPKFARSISCSPNVFPPQEIPPPAAAHQKDESELAVLREELAVVRQELAHFHETSDFATHTSHGAESQGEGRSQASAASKASACTDELQKMPLWLALLRLCGARDSQQPWCGGRLRRPRSPLPFGLDPPSLLSLCLHTFSRNSSPDTFSRHVRGGDSLERGSLLRCVTCAASAPLSADGCATAHARRKSSGTRRSGSPSAAERGTAHVRAIRNCMRHTAVVSVRRRLRGTRRHRAGEESWISQQPSASAVLCAQVNAQPPPRSSRGALKPFPVLHR